MNKVKSSFTKRFKVKANGRIRMRAANRNHILTKMSAKRKMSLRCQKPSVADVDRPIILRVLGLMGKKTRRRHQQRSQADA